VRRAGPPLVLVADTPVPVDSLVATGGGRWLVGAGTEGAVVTWDLQQRSRRLPATLRSGHRGAIESMVASDGWIVTAGADGVARAWDMTRETAEKSTATLTEDACRALGWSEPGCS
jgi:WD40 repeat protein